MKEKAINLRRALSFVLAVILSVLNLCIPVMVFVEETDSENSYSDEIDQSTANSETEQAVYHVVLPYLEGCLYAFDQTHLYLTEEQTQNQEQDIILQYHQGEKIEIEILTSFYSLAFRIISIEISKGKYEYILTNLPKDKFPAAIIKQLYKMRWNEEVSFKLLKYACALSWFHSVKRENIYQEIYARLIMYNFTSLIIKSTENDISKFYKNISKPSFSNASKVTRMFLIKKLIPARIS